MQTLHMVFLQSVLHSASVQSKGINKLFSTFTIAAVMLLLFVSALIIYICIKYRDKPGNPPPKQIGKNNRLELLMFLFPTVKIFIFSYNPDD